MVSDLTRTESAFKLGGLFKEQGSLDVPFCGDQIDAKSLVIFGGICFVIKCVKFGLVFDGIHHHEKPLNFP